MNQLAFIFGASYGALAIVLGAFGAHALKKILNNEQLKSFETGVKYQMYHALLLVILGFQFEFNTQLETVIVTCIAFGTFLFSFSIYGLVLSSARNRKLKFLGPLTPLGGLLLVTGWCFLIFYFDSNSYS